MTETGQENNSRTKIFDGILLSTIAIVFLLILFGAFNPSGEYISNVIIGIFGFASYGYFFALLTLGIVIAMGWKVERSFKNIAYFVSMFIFITLIFHTLTSYDGYILNELSFVDNYKEYLIMSFNSKTAGGIIASIFTYPLMKIRLFAQYLLLSAVLLFLIAGYTLTFLRGYGLFFRNKKPKTHRKIMVQDNIGDQLLNESVKGQQYEDDFKVRKFANRKVQYTPIEEAEEILQQKKIEKEQRNNKEKNLTDDTMDKENKTAREILFGESETTAYIDPNARNYNNVNNANIEEGTKTTRQATAFDILFNNSPINGYVNNNTEQPIQERELTPQEKALATLYPEKHGGLLKNKKPVNSTSSKDLKPADKIAIDSEARVLTKEEEIKEKIKRSYDTKSMLENIQQNLEEGKIDVSKREEKKKENITPARNQTQNDYDASQNFYKLSPEQVEKNRIQYLKSFGYNPTNDDEYIIDSRTGLNEMDTIIDDEPVNIVGYKNESVELAKSKFDEVINASNQERDKSEKEKLELQEKNRKLEEEMMNLKRMLEEKSSKTHQEEQKVQENVSAKEEIIDDYQETSTHNRFAQIVKETPKVEKIKEEEEPVEKEKPLIKFDKYVPPTVDLLKDYLFNRNQEEIDRNIEERKAIIIKTLASFKIDVTIPSVIVGPTFSMYQIDVPPNVAINRITAQESDLQLRLGVQSIVIHAPIPGKSFVGIEIPNEKRETVSFKSIVSSKEFKDDKKLAFVLGRDVEGANYVADLTKLPHLLIAGATGSGKSVGVNCLITSLIYKYSPEYVRFILVDPKQVELVSYSNLPHLLIPEPIHEPDKVISALDWAVNEMENRYQLFKDSRCQNIEQYNQSIDRKTTQAMPYIVIVIDEVADIMMVLKNSFETRVVRLTQKARAAGIHLVLATQRPSVDVITGLIKANMPGRIAYTTTSQVDSQTILGQKGAEKLLRMGDMLFVDPTKPNPIRMQGAFIDNTEIIPVVDFVKEHNRTYFDQDTIDKILPPKKKEEDILPDDSTRDKDFDIRLDPLYAQVLQFFINQGKASTTSMQMRFSTGYNKAAKFMNSMKENGYIENTSSSSSSGTKVIITQAEFDEIFGSLNTAPED